MMFRDIFGNNAQIKILDILLRDLTLAFSISDISRYTHLTRPTVYKVIKKLLKQEILLNYGKYQKSTLYTINVKSPIVRVLFDLMKI